MVINVARLAELLQRPISEQGEQGIDRFGRFAGLTASAQ
jgi:hypothetical protein